MAMGEVLERLSVELALDATEFATGSTIAQRNLGGLRDAITGLGDRWMQTGKRMSLGITAPLAGFGVLSAKAASDAEELQSAFEQTFGELSPMMNRWAQETGDAMGRSTQAMQTLGNSFGLFFNQAAGTREEAAKMSQTFAELTQDFASFHNVSEEVAAGILRSSLAGESEPLRRYGVDVSAAAVSARALEMGLAATTKELTEQDKILARYNLILENTRNAQGDIARTSGSTANQARSFGAAMEELQVVIGQKLLPVITPFIKGVTRILNAFTNLPSGVQTAIVAFGALVAAIGPLMLIMGSLAALVLPLFLVKMGGIATAISFVINPLGTLITMFGGFVAKLGALTILKGIGTLLLRFAGPLGLIATAGLLIYKNWDRISAVFAEFWQEAQAAIGPPLQELVATISGAFDELWGGPLGDGIRTAMDWVGKFADTIGEFMGDALIFVIRRLLDAMVNAFEIIGNVIRTVNALLNGDWQGAWDAAKAAVLGILIPFRTLGSFVIEQVRRLYLGVKQWLQDKLGAIFDWVNRKIETVKNGFFRLYDAVVGNSYIPDMVDEIGQHMARLDTLMVARAEKATSETAEKFRALKDLLDRLFPAQAAARSFAADAGRINDSELSDAAKKEALLRLRASSVGGGVTRAPDELATDAAKPIFDIERALKQLDATLAEAGGAVGVQTVRIAESFKDMADKALGALRGLVDGIKSGDFLGILEGVIGLFTQLGSMGVFGKGIQANVNKVPAYAGGTNFHPGGLAIVGERGPELVNMPRGSSVMTNAELKGMGRAVDVRVGIDPRNGNITAYVDGQIAAAAPAIASAGAGMANSRARFAATRAIPR